MAQFANQIGELKLPMADFAFMGNPNATEMLSDYCGTLNNWIREIAPEIEYAGSCLIDGANQYREVERKNGQLAGGH